MGFNCRTWGARMSRCQKGPNYEIMTKHLTVDTILGEIKMRKTAHPFSTYVVVEGHCDIIVFENFTIKKRCELVPANGDKHIGKLVREPMFINEKCIAIKDADCMWLNKKDETYKKLFFYDTRDLDSDIIHSDSFDSFLQKFNIQDIEQLRNKILKNCKMIGLLRCFNDKNDLGIDFNMDYNDFKSCFVPHSESLDFKKIVKELSELPKNIDNPLLKNSEALVAIIKKTYENQNDNLHNICRGHDLVLFLYIILKNRKVIKKEERFGNFELSFYNAFKLDDFKLKQLYKDIIAWEKQNGYLSIFKDNASNT
jgi:hypothetical protein